MAVPAPRIGVVHAVAEIAAPDRRMDFFLIGAQKCATSWLFSCLQEHPQVSLPRKKREIHYLGGAEVAARGKDWFFGQYGDDSGKIRGSVSVNYLSDRGALEDVALNYPQARFLVSLREPLDRAASAYTWLYRKGAIKGPTLEDALSRALDRSSAASGSLDADLLARSRYGAQLEVLVRAGAADRLMVIEYDYLQAHPRAALQRVFKFVGVDSAFDPPSFASRPKRSANLPWLMSIERRFAPRHQSVAKAMDVLNQTLCTLGLGRARRPVRSEVASAARNFLAPDMRLLAGLLQQLDSRNVIASPRFVEDWGFRGP